MTTEERRTAGAVRSEEEADHLHDPMDPLYPSSEFLATIGFAGPYYGRPAPRGFAGLVGATMRFTGRGLDRLAEAWARIYDRTRAGTRDMVLGGAICGIGVIVTWATYSMAPGGGEYIVAWGAVLFGGLQFLRGVVRSFR